MSESTTSSAVIWTSPIAVPREGEQQGSGFYFHIDRANKRRIAQWVVGDMGALLCESTDDGTIGYQSTDGSTIPFHTTERGMEDGTVVVRIWPFGPDEEPETCDRCQGKGYVIGGKCWTCNGEGIKQ